MPSARNLVSTAWLAERLGHPGLSVVDGSWHLPATERDGYREYLKAHIPGAVFFDIDGISDTASPLPHMLPDAEAFARAAGEMGLNQWQDIVVYDGAGLFSAPRVWWSLRIFGARNVYILDGGFPAWLAENRPVEVGPSRQTPTTFQASLDARQVKAVADIQAGIESGGVEIVDARPAERFRGEAPEPRPGVRAGHIPGSKSLPFTILLEEGKLASAQKIRAAIASAQIDLAKPIVTTCGSGVSAAILALAFDEIGTPVDGIYDGSWAEWGSRHDLPIATGES